MSTALVEARGPRIALGLGFMALAAADTCLILLSVRGLLQGVTGELGWGPRMIIGLFGLLLGWLVCRQLYTILVRGETPVMPALDASMMLGVALLLSVLAFAFIGPGTWVLFAIVLLALFVYAFVALWRLAGALMAILLVLGAVIAGVLTWILA